MSGVSAVFDALNRLRGKGETGIGQLLLTTLTVTLAPNCFHSLTIAVVGALPGVLNFSHCRRN